MKVMFENTDTYIYFIQMETGPIKIGRAKDPHQRLKELQVGNPYKLDLLFFSSGGIKTEQQIKGVLKSEWIRGEWYWPTQKILNIIENKEYEDKQAEQSLKEYKVRKALRDKRANSTLGGEKLNLDKKVELVELG